jgi:hypothetical protein
MWMLDLSEVRAKYCPVGEKEREKTIAFSSPRLTSYKRDS